MKNFELILQQDYSKKNKSEIVQFLTELETNLTPDLYQKISGVSSSELENLTKKELLAIIDDFKKNYDPDWEKFMKTAGGIIGDMMERFNVQDFSVSNASDSDFAAELGGLDFAKIIGGPLMACVDAQAAASASTIEFINKTAFKKDASGDDDFGFLDEDKEDRELLMANFSYHKVTKNPAYDSVTNPDVDPTIEEDVVINVPFIALVNIPSFRIESCTIDFNVKLNSVFTNKTTNINKINMKYENSPGLLRSLFDKSTFSVSMSNQRSTTTGVKVQKEYSLKVHVEATNDEMPSGLEKVLGLLGG